MLSLKGRVTLCVMSIPNTVMVNTYQDSPVERISMGGDIINYNSLIFQYYSILIE